MLGFETHFGPHAGFILGAYAFTGLVMGGLVLNAIRDRRAQERALEDLQRRDRP
ncbi:heme exporter protein CcmD [Methylobacterium oxalidis]|uniref:heme exporter protein CcmD n=1 Tax=Methylobacterium oxalidis TaxID=944322 RepID=UPI003315C7B2